MIVSRRKGVCRVGKLPVVSSFSPHFGEERPLVGQHGSGTIFLTWCNLRCVFCQNYDISHLGMGDEVEVEQLGKMMLSLQRQGCHNINFVVFTGSPDPGGAAAVERGRRPPVYNCGGYEEPATLRLLDGIFDIYMPDFKYGDSATALRFSGSPRYVETAKRLKEMHRQVGDLVMDDVASPCAVCCQTPGPSAGLAGTAVMDFTPGKSPRHLRQHHGPVLPCYKAHVPPHRRITAEFKEAVAIAAKGIQLDGISDIHPTSKSATTVLKKMPAFLFPKNEIAIFDTHFSSKRSKPAFGLYQSFPNHEKPCNS
jgi:putative pyruvate formate lyase activating enzyme